MGDEVMDEVVVIKYTGQTKKGLTTEKLYVVEADEDCVDVKFTWYWMTMESCM